MVWARTHALWGKAEEGVLAQPGNDKALGHITPVCQCLQRADWEDVANVFTEIWGGMTKDN